ncbi:hypothetical protein TMEN_4306 [Trichophyton mentagrophytes]|nr:hypothetical protein TMEN_4306 [Trichophyton mentagrophytes]
MDPSAVVTPGSIQHHTPNYQDVMRGISTRGKYATRSVEHPQHPYLDTTNMAQSREKRIPGERQGIPEFKCAQFTFNPHSRILLTLKSNLCFLLAFS